MDSSAVYRHHRAIYRAALRLLQDERDAEDVTQQVMVAGVLKYEAWRGDCSLLTWLWAIMLRKVGDMKRSRAHEARVVEAMVVEQAEAAEERAEQETAEEREARVWAALDCVPDEYRVVLVLQHIDGHSVDEVSRIMGWTKRRTETAITRARQLFRRAYGEEMEEDGQEDSAD